MFLRLPCHTWTVGGTSCARCLLTGTVCELFVLSQEADVEYVSLFELSLELELAIRNSRVWAIPANVVGDSAATEAGEDSDGSLPGLL